MTPLSRALTAIASLRVYPEIDELLTFHPTYQKLLDQGVESISPKDGYAFLQFAANDLINCLNRLASYNGSEAIATELHNALLPVHYIEYLNGNAYCLRLYIAPESTYDYKQAYTRINTYAIIRGNTPQHAAFLLHHANIRFIRILVDEHPPIHVITANNAEMTTKNAIIWAQNSAGYICPDSTIDYHHRIVTHLDQKDSPIFYDQFDAYRPCKILHQYDWIMSIT